MIKWPITVELMPCCGPIHTELCLRAGAGGLINFGWVAQLNSPCLLIVDDDPGMCSLLKRIAESCGYTAVVAPDGTTFQQIYDRSDAKVVIVDLLIAEVDGIEILRSLAEVGSQASILLVSGYDRRVLETAFRYGEALGLKMAAALPKPLDLKRLRTLLGSLKEPD